MMCFYYKDSSTSQLNPNPCKMKFAINALNSHNHAAITIANIVFESKSTISNDVLAKEF